MVQKTRLLKIVALLTLAVTSGCSGSAAPDATAPAEPGVSPLAEYLNAVYGTPLSAEEQAKANQEFELANEQLVAQCMHDAGFEYFVTVSAEPAVARDAFEQDRDFVAQWVRSRPRQIKNLS